MVAAGRWMHWLPLYKLQDRVCHPPRVRGLGLRVPFHDRLPVMLNDGQVLFRETKQNGLIYPKITLGPICKVLIGHEKHGVAFMPKGTGLEGLIVLLHIVDNIADQPFLGTDPVFPRR